MLRKKIGLFCFAAVFAVVLMAGCGRKEAGDLNSPPSETAESETAGLGTEKSETVAEDESGAAADSIEEESTGTEKNVEVFAERIQEAVGDRDIQAFADLLSYPCVFITGDEETIVLNNQEDLFKQNPDMVFEDNLMVAIANVDTVSLKMTDKGVIMGEGTSKITFQKKSDGSFGITEIRE